MSFWIVCYMIFFPLPTRTLGQALIWMYTLMDFFGCHLMPNMEYNFKCLKFDPQLAGPSWELPVGQCLDFLNHCNFGGNDLIIPCSCRYGRDAKVVHFLGKVKPWDYSYDTTNKTVKGQSQGADMHPNYLLQWWELFSSSVLALMKEEYGDQPFHSGCTEVSSAFTQSVSGILEACCNDD